MIFKRRCYFVACSKSYGENCQYPCSPLCINQTCDPLNGTCLTSCKEVSYGDKCIAGNFYTYFLEYLSYKYLRFVNENMLRLNFVNTIVSFHTNLTFCFQYIPSNLSDFMEFLLLLQSMWQCLLLNNVFRYMHRILI